MAQPRRAMAGARRPPARGPGGARPRPRPPAEEEEEEEDLGEASSAMSELASEGEEEAARMPAMPAARPARPARRAPSLARAAAGKPTKAAALAKKKQLRVQTARPGGAPDAQLDEEEEDEDEEEEELAPRPQRPVQRPVQRSVQRRVSSTAPAAASAAAAPDKTKPPGKEAPRNVRKPQSATSSSASESTASSSSSSSSSGSSDSGSSSSSESESEDSASDSDSVSSAYDSESSYSTLASDESGYSEQVRRRKRRRRRRRKKESPLLRSLSKFLPPLLALPIFLLLRLFVLWPWNFVWGFSKRGALLVMYAQPHVERAYHFVRENFPWSTAREAAVVSLRLSAEGAKLGAKASVTGTSSLWASSQIWGERGVVIGRALGLAAGRLVVSAGRATGNALSRLLFGVRDAVLWTVRGIGNLVFSVLTFPLRVGRFVAYLPWTLLDFARGFTEFFRENQDTLADVIATIIGMYLMGLLLGVLLGPVAVKLGWMSYETLDALGVAELCVSIGLLKKPGWFIW